MSRETDALGDIGIAVFAGHSMVVLNRFVTPEKSTGAGFADKDL
jgi:hypothetical protein